MNYKIRDYFDKSKKKVKRPFFSFNFSLLTLNSQLSTSHQYSLQAYAVFSHDAEHEHTVTELRQID